MIFNAGGRIPSGVELLWTNDAPNEDFTNKTILPEILNYKILYIVFKASTTAVNVGVSMISTAIPFDDDMCQRIRYVDDLNTTSRDIYITPDGLRIMDAKNVYVNNSITTTNNKVIPLYIYGSHKMV